MESFKKIFLEVLHQLQKKKTESNVEASGFRIPESNVDTTGNNFRREILPWWYIWSHLERTCTNMYPQNHEHQLHGKCNCTIHDSMFTPKCCLALIIFFWSLDSDQLLLKSINMQLTTYITTSGNVFCRDIYTFRTYWLRQLHNHTPWTCLVICKVFTLLQLGTATIGVNYSSLGVICYGIPTYRLLNIYI